MAKRLDEAANEAIRKDLAEGMSVNAAATKHGTSWQTVKNLAGGKSGKTKTATKKSPEKKTTSHTSGAYDAVIAELREKVNKLNQVIEQLETL